MIRVLVVSVALFALPLTYVSACALAQKEQQKSATSGAEYTCPMHPEIRSGEKGKCPKCEMELVAVLPEVMDDFHLRMTATPNAPEPGKPVRLVFQIFNPKTGEQVKDFALLHEKLFHLFLVSQDLNEFQHIHPVFTKDGSFAIETILPKAGQYKVYCDFFPQGGAPQVLQQHLTTAGYASDLFAATPKLEADAKLVKLCEGEKITKANADNIGVVLSTLKPVATNSLNIELKLEPAEIIAGKPTTLRYHLSDARSGAPIKDLSPYLGAFGHTLILSDDQTDYVHSHPEEIPADPFDPDVADDALFFGGPVVTFEAMFPRPGIYRIWTQFLRGDTLATVTFTVRADRLR